MQVYVILFSALIVLAAYEMRHRQTMYEIVEMKDMITGLRKEISALKADMKLKRNVYEEGR